MSDLIRREDVISKFVGLDMQVYEGDKCVGIRTYLTKEEIIYVIDNIPSADPDRKKGEWVYDGIRGRFPACKCSICGHYENADWALLQGTNYCPNCGAYMKGE